MKLRKRGKTSEVKGEVEGRKEESTGGEKEKDEEEEKV